MPSRTIRIVVIEAGKDPVGYLLDDQLLVGLALFTPPEDPVGVPFHVFDIVPGVLILGFTELYGEAGLDFLCVHNTAGFTIFMPFWHC